MCARISVSIPKGSLSSVKRDKKASPKMISGSMMGRVIRFSDSVAAAPPSRAKNPFFAFRRAMPSAPSVPRTEDAATLAAATIRLVLSASPKPRSPSNSSLYH